MGARRPFDTGNNPEQKRTEEQNMATIFKRALNLYGDEQNIDAVWDYLNTLIMIGAIEEGAAEQIAYMIESEV
jgi:hypothetical protein